MGRTMELGVLLQGEQVLSQGVKGVKGVKGVRLEWRLDKAQVFFLQRLESLRVWRGRE